MSRILLPVVIAALPLVLLMSSLQTFRELEAQKTVFLRNVVAAVAGHLEGLPATVTPEEAYEALSADEPNLVDVELIARDSRRGNQRLLADLWSGRELFRTEMLTSRGTRVFRAYVPFHSAAGLRIARIDVDAAAADFLMTHARHNVIAASAGGLVLVLLAIYAVWASRRAARLEVRQLEMEHLAHMGKMAAVLAHEIRNPLGTIKGFAQLAGERPDPALRALVDPIVEEARRLENLVNDLLLYGRPPVPEIRAAAWRETLAPLEADARHAIGDRGIRFSAAASELVWDTDPRLLRQALLNLVRNALEAAAEGEGGEVRLEVHAGADGGLELAVIDNGQGIPDAVRDRLAEPFFTTKASGTGLGLAITRKLAESLGGKLTLEGAEPHGTRAVLSFPHARARQPAGA